MKLNDENISNFMQMWRDEKNDFTKKDLDDLLWFLQNEKHVQHVNSALDVFPLVFNMCENKVLENKIDKVFNKIKKDVGSNTKLLYSLLDLFKTKNILSEEEYTDLIEKSNA